MEPLLITVPLLTLRAYRCESFIKHEKQQRSAQQPGGRLSQPNALRAA